MKIEDKEENVIVGIDKKNEFPIGIFDSGVGGLTVAKEIMRQLPNENLVYFGDTARVPYGSKSKETIIRYTRQIIRFLKTKNVKAIVIACNTASALALDVVREEVDIPVIGVVMPGAKTAVATTMNGKIGVIGTAATVQSEIYTKLMQGYNPLVEVVGKACPLFVPFVEEGLAKHKMTQDVIAYYLEGLKDSGIDTLILGCTHYPLLRSSIHEYMGEQIQLINPAYETARSLKTLLEEEGMMNLGIVEGQAVHTFYVSDAADRFSQFANSILPCEIETTKQISIEEY